MNRKYKSIYHAVLAIALLWVPPGVLRADSDSEESGIRASSEERSAPSQRKDTRREQAEMLESLLDMSPQRLANTRALIERLERMDEKERETLRKRVRAFHSQSPEEIARQRERWRKMSPEERAEFRRQLRDLSSRETEIAEEETVNPHIEKRFEKYFRDLPPEERRRVMSELRTAAQSSDAD